MKFAGIRAMLPIAFLAVGIAASGCDKAKEALQDAAGFKLLDDAEKDQILKDVNWDVTKNPGLASFKVHKAFEVTDKFKGDFSKSASLPIPVDAPEQAQGAADKQRSVLLVKKETFKTDDTTSYTRLRIVTVARVDSANNELVIDGEQINQYIPKNKQISLDAGNQAGQYLLIEGQKVQLAFLTGNVKLLPDGKTADADAVAVNGDTLVFTSSSPFVTLAGDGASEGKYFLAMLEGSKGTVFGYNKAIGTQAVGTPTTVTKEMAYSGVLDEYKGQVDGKVGKLNNAEATTKSNELFTKANTVVTNFVNGWKLVVTDLRFKQPYQAPPAAPPKPTPAQASTDKPTPAKPAETPPKPDTQVVRKPDAGEAYYNVDLGCSGYDAEYNAFNIVRDGSKFDDYQTAPGWRATGDVRYAYEEADKIFPMADLGDNYLDGVAGYCLLATGDQTYQLAGNDPAYLPGPEGAGQTSEMWQKVNVPADAKAIQMRVAFFSSEFPAYVGSSFNDSFFVKFDESIEMLAFGTLNDLAGGTAEASVSGCASANSAYSANATCGEWGYTKDGIGTGILWDVAASTQMPADGANFGCEGTKCYHGMIKSRIICKDLTSDDAGKLRTLRFNVSDAGDAYFDSALAVDSVVFSKTACGDAAGRMTPATVDPDSKARTVN